MRASATALATRTPPSLLALLTLLTASALTVGSLSAQAPASATTAGNAAPSPDKAGDKTGAAGSVTAGQLRHMTAAQFQAGIDKEGAQAFTARLTRDTDPHNWDEPNYDIILNHISSGETAWLKIAGEIGPYAADPSFNKGLNVALAYALLENPTGVLRMRRDVHHTGSAMPADDHVMSACMYPFPQPSESFVRSYQRRALVALKRVRSADLQAQAEDCRKELLSPPTEKASN